MSNIIIIPPAKTQQLNIKHNEKRISLSAPIINPIFKGTDVFLIGGGNSLANFNFNLLKGKSIITINRSFIHVPFAQVLYFSDHRFYLWATGKLGDDIELSNHYKNYSGLKYSIINKINDPTVTILKNTGKTGFDLKPGCIRHGGNSGYAAINLAYHLGAKRIILMGYDMKLVNGKSHYHNGYISKQNEKIYKHFLEPFHTLKGILDDNNITVYNTSMNSDLNIFEKKRIELFL